MRTHLPGTLYEVRPTARFPLSIAIVLPISKENHNGERTHRDGGSCPQQSNRSQVPRKGRRSQTHGGWNLDECGMVARPTESQDSAPKLPPVRSDGKGVQLR